MRIYVGNLPYSTGDSELAEAFSPFGEVPSASVVMDRETGRSRGFGFITFQEEAAAQNAISQMDGQEFDGRPLKVNKALERERGGGNRNFRRDSW